LPRPAKWRCLECLPGAKLFGPVGVPAEQLDKVHLAFDELEAMRLLHLEGVTQAEAGRRLGVSGSTVSRMAERAHRVVTEALVQGKGLCVESGPVTVVRVEESLPVPAARGQQETASSEGDSMIVAVPYLGGQVNPHFGSTQAFMIAETADGKVQRTSVYEVHGMQHNHTGIAGFLKEQGVGVILAGGMGAPMQQALKRAGFDLYCGVGGAALDAVEAFLRGEIEQSESTCTHHQGGHHHGRHQGEQ